MKNEEFHTRATNRAHSLIATEAGRRFVRSSAFTRLRAEPTRSRVNAELQTGEFVRLNSWSDKKNPCVARCSTRGEITAFNSASRFFMRT